MIEVSAFRNAQTVHWDLTWVLCWREKNYIVIRGYKTAKTAFKQKSWKRWILICVQKLLLFALTIVRCVSTYPTVICVCNRLVIVVLKMFKCEQCEVTFSRKDTLTRHLKCHNNTEQIKCLICSTIFSRRDALKRHMKSIHGE